MGIWRKTAQENTIKVIQDSEIRPPGEISRFEKNVVRRGFNGGITDALTPHQDLQGIITPNELHYYVNGESGATPHPRHRAIPGCTIRGPTCRVEDPGRAF